jgi:pimeloyl-ACP methyl ester carboxylesterase
MSAVIAMVYAASHPVRGFVDIDQPIDPRPFAQLLRRIEPQLRGDDFAAAFAPFQQSMGLELVADPIRTELLARQRIRQELVLGYWDEILRTGPGQMGARVEEIARRIDAPALYIFGRELSPDHREYLLGHIPHAQLEIWPGGGHFVHLAEPGRFAARLRTFIDHSAGESSESSTRTPARLASDFRGASSSTPLAHLAARTRRGARLPKPRAPHQPSPAHPSAGVLRDGWSRRRC